MQQQITLEQYAEILKEDGINRAVEHADRVSYAWSKRALNILKDFLRQSPAPFMAENFRAYAEKQGLEDPPSKRAFGGVITKAKGLGWIKSVGFGLTQNPLAHRTPAAIWKSCLILTPSYG